MWGNVLFGVKRKMEVKESGRDGEEEEDDDDRKDRDRGGGLENRIGVYAGGDRDKKWKELKS